MPEQDAIRFKVSGRVQGVGFRYFTQRRAKQLGLIGWVRNRSDGDVEGEAQGTPEAIVALREALRKGPRLGRVEKLETEQKDVDPHLERFEVRY